MSDIDKAKELVGQLTKQINDKRGYHGPLEMEPEICDDDTSELIGVVNTLIAELAAKDAEIEDLKHDLSCIYDPMNNKAE